jgi:exodeoxyribonuclease VII large subunit
LHALRPQARLDGLQRRQEDAKRRLDAAWAIQHQRRRARLQHSTAVLHALRPQRRLERLRERLHGLAPRAQAAVARDLQRHALRLQGLARSLEAVSPLATVARGYSILQREDGRVVRSVAEVAAGDGLRARLHDGVLRLRVDAAPERSGD